MGVQPTREDPSVGNCRKCGRIVTIKNRAGFGAGFVWCQRCADEISYAKPVEPPKKRKGFR